MEEENEKLSNGAGEAGDAADKSDPFAEVDALRKVIEILNPLREEARYRVMEAVAKFLQINLREAAINISPAQSTARTPRTPFSEDTSMSPKEFMLEKQPRTDVERVACLAYYLTHYRDTPHFKTLEISKLNTEAAQPKFANAAYSVANAVQSGLLVPSSKGNRQLSAAGEQFVLALPDREAAKQAMAAMRPRRRSRKARGASSSARDNND